MKIRSLLALCGLLIFAARSFAAPPSPEAMQLFLLIGQSNMAGRGTIEPQDQQTNPRIFVLTKDLQWVPAKDPLHFDKPSVAGVGPSMEFARTLAKADPNTNIGLVPCAMGGSKLDEWQPGGKLYIEAVTRAREAMKKGTLAGILWHQGESDLGPDKIATYTGRFSTMITQFRTDLHAETTPVVVGELGRFHVGSEAFNTMLPELVRHVPRSACVSSEGLTDKGDHTHFNTPSQRTLGQRYAAAYLQLAATPGDVPAR